MTTTASAGTLISHLASVVAPVFVTVAIGWGWARSRRPYDTAFVSQLVMSIGAPALAFSTLSNLSIEGGALLRMGLAMVAAIALFAAIAAPVLYLAKLPLRSFLGPLMFSNTGNMGLSLCLFGFGRQGLALGIVVYAVVSVGQYTVNVWLNSGENSPARLIRVPVLQAVVLALLVLATGYRVPHWIDNTTKLIGDFTIPLMLLTLGVSLAELKVINARRAAGLASLRLLMGFVVGVAVAKAFGLTGISRGVLILQCSMPSAVLNYMLAARYRRDPQEVAGLVVLSTVMSLITLPLLLGFLHG